MRIGLLTRRFVNPYTPSRALAEDNFTAASVRGCSEIRPRRSSPSSRQRSFSGSLGANATGSSRFPHDARIQRGHALLHALGARQVRLALPHRVAHREADFADVSVEQDPASVHMAA